MIKKAFTSFPAAIATYLALGGIAWLVASKWF
jgi:hypothetical protein